MLALISAIIILGASPIVGIAATAAIAGFTTLLSIAYGAVTGVIITALDLNGTTSSIETVNTISTISNVVSTPITIIAGAIAVMIKNIQRWSYRKENKLMFWVAYNLLFISLGIVSLAEINDPTYMLLILLWILLPITNAPMDWLSLGFTRGLLQAVRTGNHSGWRTLIWAAADLLLAFIFLFLITAVLVGVTALGKAVAGKTLVNIGCIISKVQTDRSAPDHWWIYFMLLSTLVPTLFHFALAGGAATLWLPRKWRTQLADGLEEDTHKTFAAWAYLTFTPVVGFILMPLALLGSLWWLLNTNSGALGTLLLNWATGLAQWADPAMMLSCSTG